MTNEQKEELKNFLIYLHLLTMDEFTITTQGRIAIHELSIEYPQFRDIKKENQKWFEVIEKLWDT